MLHNVNSHTDMYIVMLYTVNAHTVKIGRTLYIMNLDTGCQLDNVQCHFTVFPSVIPVINTPSPNYPLLPRELTLLVQEVPN